MLNVRRDGRYYILECSQGVDPRAEIMKIIVNKNRTLLSLEKVKMSLEDIFLKLISDKKEI